MKLYSDYHAKLLGTGLALLTDHWRTLCFTGTLLVGSLIAGVFLATLVTLITSDTIGGSVFVVTILIMGLLIPALILMGAVLMDEASKSGTDKWNWFQEVGDFFPEVFLTSTVVTIGYGFFISFFATIAGSVVSLPSFSVLELLPDSGPGLIVSYSLSLLAITLMVSLSFIGCFWSTIALVTLPARRLVRQASWLDVILAEGRLSYKRLADFFVWGVALQLVLSLIWLKISEAFILAGIGLSYFIYVTGFVTEACRLRGKKDPE